VAEGWRRLHDEVLHNVYALPTMTRVVKSRRMRLARRVESMGEMRKTFTILIGKPKGNRPVGRSRCGWECSIKMDITKIRWEIMDWMHLV